MQSAIKFVKTTRSDLVVFFVLDDEDGVRAGDEETGDV